MTAINDRQTDPFPIFPQPVRSTAQVKSSSLIGTAVSKLLGGGLRGYFVYEIQRGMIYMGMMKHSAPFSALPNVLAGVAEVGIIESAKLTYFIVLKVMGDRAIYENLPPSSVGGHLRNRAWKVVASIENVEKKVDALFSYVFGLRRRQQVEEEGISIVKPVFLEVYRREFWSQTIETLSTALPQGLGIGLIEACGYSILRVHVSLSFYVGGFVLSLFLKIGNAYKLREQALENLAYEEQNKLAIQADVQQMETEDGFIMIDPSDAEKASNSLIACFWHDVKDEDELLTINPNESEKDHLVTV